MSQRAPRLPEGRFLHPRCSDGGADELGRASTLPLQRGAVQALRAHHAAGALRRGRTGPGGVKPQNAGNPIVTFQYISQGIANKLI